MTALIRKELTTIICSVTGLGFAIIFLLACGLILWLFPGSSNILDNGYAVTDSFYKTASILLLILTPALTMRLISEEKRSHTLDLLRSRPVKTITILFSKWLSALIFVILIFISTLVYIYTIYKLGTPVGNIDIRIVTLTYLSLIIITSVFLISGILASSLTNNQIIAFLAALSLNFILLYGMDMMSSVIHNPQVKSHILNLSLSFHTDRIRKGLLYLNDITLFLGYIILLFTISILILGKIKLRSLTILIGITSLSIAMTLIPVSARLDLTKDKRYTISPESTVLMEAVNKNNTSISINIYFTGDLNYGLKRLQTSALDLLNELNEKAGNRLSISIINPYSLGMDRETLPQYMAEKSMPAIQLNEIDRNGKISRQLIYPYAQVTSNGDTLSIPLLKSIRGNTAEENLNASIEDLEFQFSDAIRLLTNKENQNIAFIEGHGELPRTYIYDAEESLAKYYNINRGQITNDVSVLDNFKVVIIAGPTEKYTEKEKFILDQYLMRGGRILWIIDGAYVSYKELTEKGESPSIKNEVNLDDMLFNYGVRINSDFIQDATCTTIPVNSTDGSSYINLPWYYSPILLPSADNAVTKDIAGVKASFASSLNPVNKKLTVTPKVLLTTSDKSHIVRIPEMISLDIEKIQDNKDYFDTSFIPVAISLEGIFTSAFENRMMPDSISIQKDQILTKSKPTKMIVVSSSDIIRNDIETQNGSPQILPMGYDRSSGKTFGNKDFIVNSVHWLSDDSNWMHLRTKSRQMNLLDKQKISENRNLYVFINISCPIFFILLVCGAFSMYRKKKYSNKKRRT